MNKIMRTYKLAPLLLMVMAFDYSLFIEPISRKIFKGATFKERVEMLKLRFEGNLIDCRQELQSRVDNEAFSDEEQKQLLMEMINISKSIEATCKKKKGKAADNSVLFHCFLHNDSNPSMSWSAEQHGFYCFGCSKDNKVFDLFDFLKLSQGLNGPKAFKKAFKIATMIMVEDGDKIENPFLEVNNSKHSSYIPYTKEMNKVRHWTFLYNIEQDQPALNNLIERGISLNTAKRMAVMTWYPTIENNPYGLCYWIFINDDGSYSRRLASMNENQYPKQFDKPMKWWNPKNKSMGIFNTRVLSHCRQFQEVCFVTESAIDTMSCEELGFHSVGLNSINNLSKFFSEYVDKQADIMLICLTDNDEVGKSVVESFTKRKLYVPEHLQVGYLGSSWLSKFKDVNEALVADKDLTLEALKDIEKKAKKYYESIGIEND